MVKNKWQANADRSASGRISTKKTNTFAIDTAIHIAITGTSNPNDAVVGRVNSILKSGSNTTDNTAFTAARIARSGGTIVPPKFSKKYLLVSTETVEPDLPIPALNHKWH
jgi:hypothetical protein